MCRVGRAGEYAGALVPALSSAVIVSCCAALIVGLTKSQLRETPATASRFQGTREEQGEPLRRGA